jgi:hypothetical protein
MSVIIGTRLSPTTLLRCFLVGPEIDVNEVSLEEISRMLSSLLIHYFFGKATRIA